MKRLGTCAILIMTLAISVPAWADGTVEEVTFYSNAMGKDMVALVYLPEGYDSSGVDYPVVFLNGGFGTGYGNWLSTKGLTDEIDSMVGNGLVNPFILVEIDQLTMPWPQLPVPMPSFLVDSELNGAYETMLIDDLVPWVDATYRTLGSRDDRYIFGRSAGGFATMRVATRHWEVFGGIGTQVGSIASEVLPGAIPLILEEYPDGPPYELTPTAGTWSMYLFSWGAALTPNMTNPPWYIDLVIDEDGNLDPDVWQRFSSNNATRWAAEMATAGGQLEIFMGAGDQDFYLPFTTVFADILDGLGLPHMLQVFHGDHDNPPPSIRFKSHITYFFPLNATLELSPGTLDGNHWWPLVEATVELPGDLNVVDIDTATLAISQINGEDLEHPLRALVASDISDVNGNGRDDLTVWFWKPCLLRRLAALGVEENTPFNVTVEGETTDLLFLAATDEQTAVNMAQPEAMPPFWPFAIR